MGTDGGATRLLAHMPASIFEAVEFVDWLRAGVAGWRYLFSSSFRAETHARWRQETPLWVLSDILCGVAGIAFTLVIVYLVISLFSGWDWIQRLGGDHVEAVTMVEVGRGQVANRVVRSYRLLLYLV